jgi:hypothetical protein
MAHLVKLIDMTRKRLLLAQQELETLCRQRDDLYKECSSLSSHGSHQVSKHDEVNHEEVNKACKKEETSSSDMHTMDPLNLSLECTGPSQPVLHQE